MDVKDSSSDTSSPNNCCYRAANTCGFTNQQCQSSMEKISKGGRNVCVSSTCTKLYIPSLSQSHCHLSTNPKLLDQWAYANKVCQYTNSSPLPFFLSPLGLHIPVYFIVRAILHFLQMPIGAWCTLWDLRNYRNKSLRAVHK